MSRSGATPGLGASGDTGFAAARRRKPVVAVDAMGGDRAPADVVAGVLRAVAEHGASVLLFGREDTVAPLLGSAPPEGVELCHAGEVVSMGDEPAAAVRRKKDSSLVRCAEAVRDGRAQAMMTAGNTGAAMASALLRVGRIRGVARPAIGTLLPVLGRRRTLLIDCGATVDCDPAWLLQFARMGAEYVRLRLGVAEARIGLLSNGEEPGKGDELRKAAHGLLVQIPGFVGNVEGGDLLAGLVDVVVTDGFSGNVALKTLEGSFSSFFGELRSELRRHELGGPAAAVVEEVAEWFDPENQGGGVLLGVKGVCVISHGSSSPKSVANAIRLATECVRDGVVEQMKEAIVHGG